MDELIYEPVFAALARHEVRYLVAGGIAVILYGWPRFTKDLDLMLDLRDRGNVERFAQAMKELGFQPFVPVALESLADPSERERWVREKGAMVLNLGHQGRPLERIDIFLSDPVDFETAFAERESIRVRTLEIPVLSLKTLIAVKEKAGRPQDIEDAKRLRAILYRREKE